MKDILGDMDNILVYIDDILTLQNEGELEDDHLWSIKKVLRKLEEKGFKANL